MGPPVESSDSRLLQRKHKHASGLHATNKYIIHSTHLGGALTRKTNLLYGLGPIPVAGKNVYTSRFSVFFQNSQNCRQITATPGRSIFHAAKSLQMPYKATNQQNTYFRNKIKNPLELRLATVTHPMPPPHLLALWRGWAT
jgi:hypothetical protein